MLAQSKTPILSSAEIKAIFGYLELITKLHMKLFSDLSRRMSLQKTKKKILFFGFLFSAKKKISVEDFGPDTRIADLFNVFFTDPGTFKVYTKYVQVT